MFLELPQCGAGRREEPMVRIELTTSPLPRVCSTTELHGPGKRCRFPLLFPWFKRSFAGAGEGNRTLVVSLEGFCSTIELHPRGLPDLVEGEGFEPSKAEPADLQSAPFDRSGTPPTKPCSLAISVPKCQTTLNQRLFSPNPRPEAPRGMPLESSREL